MNMREQFESLPEIGDKFPRNKYDENRNAYLYDNHLSHVACFVNGAWYAYQEQQKKINELEALLYGE